MAFSHNLHILLGKNAGQNISRIKEYVNKYGCEYIDGSGKPVTDFLKFLLLNDDEQFYSAEKKKIEKDVFISGIEDEYIAELVPCETVLDAFSLGQLRFFFEERFVQTVNMQSRGDGKLHVCIHVPLFIENCWEKAKLILEAIHETGSNYTVDLLLIAADLASLYIEEEDILRDEIENLNKLSATTLKEIADTKVSGKFDKFDNIILVSNKNESGIALNLNRDSYANLIGEYALATTTFYSQIYHAAFLNATRTERPVLGLGISMLHFDRFYFVQYMLKKAYSHILKREGLDKQNVDINVVAPRVQDILGENINVFTSLYNSEVQPRIDRKMPHDEIRAEIQPIIEREINNLHDKFLEYLNSEEICLPEKRAILAQLLGEDDVILSGALVDGENHAILDDCRQEALDNFIEANNALYNYTIVKTTNTENNTQNQCEEHPLRKFARLSSGSGASVESAMVKLSGIKQKRDEIKTGAAYIRNMEEQLKTLGYSIKTEEESRKRLTKDGFEFEGETFYVMPKNIEVPLNETYEPKTDNLPEEVDLRKMFTPIKNQGSLGSCSAFAMVSIYEYILKKNEKCDTDLSELFAYHNARVRANKSVDAEDGSSLYDIVMGMGEQGICLEKYHPYTVDRNAAEPSLEAKTDAETRKVTKALNVERKIDHIKAAVAEGYPVAISLCIYDSFATNTGFVSYPSDAELKGDAGYHAMVVCGYSDKEKVFVVRNSWGEDFGDNGYCYIPYSYIGNDSLLNVACIITEISLAELKVGGLVENTPVSFNREDSKVLVALLKNQIEEEKKHLTMVRSKLAEQRQEYLALVTNVGNPNIQKELIKGTKERLALELEDLSKKRTNLINERHQKLERHNENKVLFWKLIGGISGAIVIIFTLLNLYIENKDVLNYLGFFNAIQVASVAFLLIMPFVNKKMGEGIPEDILPFYDNEVGKVKKYWLLSVIALVVVYIFLSLYKVIKEPYDVAFGWQLALVLLGFVPFVCLMIIHNGISKQIENSYDNKQNEVEHERLKKEDELECLDTFMFTSSVILDKDTKLISNLNNTYSYLYSYVQNLRIWYEENEAIEEIPPLNRQPFMSLTDNSCLDAFFKSSSDDLTSEVKLYELFRNYKDMSDRGIVSLKNSLKEKMKIELMRKTEDFSIYDYATETRTFTYVNKEYVNLNQQLQNMDLNSEIFVQLNNRVQNNFSKNTSCKMLFRGVTDNANKTQWDNSVNDNFSGGNPMVYDIASQSKMFVIRIEALDLKEIRMLRVLK